MADVPVSSSSQPPSPEEIRELLREIRQQNIVLKRYICILAGGLTLLILMQTELIQTVISYAIIVLIVMAVLLTAPMWSQLVVGVTDRIPWYPKRKPDPRDSAT
jgi:hypothetical protein